MFVGADAAAGARRYSNFSTDKALTTPASCSNKRRLSTCECDLWMLRLDMRCVESLRSDLSFDAA